MLVIIVKIIQCEIILDVIHIYFTGDGLLLPFKVAVAQVVQRTLR